MNISMLQSLMSRTRNEIYDLHAHLESYYEFKKMYAKEGILSEEYLYHNYIKEAKKEIERLVLLKKALKEDYFEQLYMSRFSQHVGFREI